MSPLGAFTAQSLSVLTIVGDILVLFLFCLLFVRSGSLLHVRTLITKHALLLAFTVSLSAVIGATLFSNVVGFPPCELCWYQRIFLYPQAVIFGVALLKKNESAFSLVLPLSFIGTGIALYHSLIQWGVGVISFLPCTAEGAECSKVFFTEFGFITIPVMSLTAFLLLIVIGLLAKKGHS
ncbi:MAG: disulfide bond formation protein B [Patescibacteria group bacterium]